MDKIKIFLKKNWLIILILIVGSFLRLYRIGEYMTFLGDEGRDAIIVRRLLVNKDPILIGPGTSIGNMYLGPLYYYLIAIPLLLANFSPIGPSVFVAFLGIFTIYFVYHVGREWFSEKVGFIAAILYAISPTVIIYSRSSWNPNVMPFFALLCIYSIWRVYKYNQHKWLLVLGVSFAFVLQTHYLGLLLAPVLFIYWLLSKPKTHIRYSIYAALIFMFLMSPLLLFDFRHNWMNTRALYKFFTVRQETVSVKPWTAIPKVYPIFEQINGSMLVAKNEFLAKYITLFMFISLVFGYIKDKKKFFGKYNMLLIWIGIALIGFGIYKQHIYDHYFGFIFPAIFILFSGLVVDLYKNANKIGKFLITLVLIYMVYINLINSPVLFSPNRQMQRAQNVANKVIEESKGEKFNIAVLAERNYEDGYQYFMEKQNAKIVEIDAQIKESVTNQLFAICEMPEEKCDPTHSAKAEVANFGWSKIESQWEVDGVTIYKLIHTK